MFQCQVGCARQVIVAREVRGRLEPINLSRKSGANRGGRCSVSGIHSGFPVICPQSEARARYTALTPSADQVLLLPRGYSFFNSAVQFSATVTGSVDVVAVSIRNRLPSGATSQPKTCEETALWAI